MPCARTIAGRAPRDRRVSRGAGAARPAASRPHRSRPPRSAAMNIVSVAQMRDLEAAAFASGIDRGELQEQRRAARSPKRSIDCVEPGRARGRAGRPRQQRSRRRASPPTGWLRMGWRSSWSFRRATRSPATSWRDCASWAPAPCPPRTPTTFDARSARPTLRSMRWRASASTVALREPLSTLAQLLNAGRQTPMWSRWTCRAASTPTRARCLAKRCAPI